MPDMAERLERLHWRDVPGTLTGFAGIAVGGHIIAALPDEQADPAEGILRVRGLRAGTAVVKVASQARTPEVFERYRAEAAAPGEGFLGARERDGWIALVYRA
jgi:hypothetical protein